MKNSTRRRRCSRPSEATLIAAARKQRMTEVVRLATAGHPVEAVELACVYIAAGQVDDEEMCRALEASGRRLTIGELLVMYEHSTDPRERQVIALALDGELLPTPGQQ